MSIAAKSTAADTNPQVEAPRDQPTTDGNVELSGQVLDRLVAVTETVRTATARGLGSPVCVTVNELGCAATLDTAALLGWGGLFSPRPIVTTYSDSPYVLLTGTIDGQPWQLHNGEPVPPPGARRPWAPQQPSAPLPAELPAEAMTAEAMTAEATEEALVESAVKATAAAATPAAVPAETAAES